MTVKERLTVPVGKASGTVRRLVTATVRKHSRPNSLSDEQAGGESREHHGLWGDTGHLTAGLTEEPLSPPPLEDPVPNSARAWLLLQDGVLGP